MACSDTARLSNFFLYKRIAKLTTTAYIISHLLNLQGHHYTIILTWMTVASRFNLDQVDSCLPAGKADGSFT